MTHKLNPMGVAPFVNNADGCSDPTKKIAERGLNTFETLVAAYSWWKAMSRALELEPWEKLRDRPKPIRDLFAACERS